MIQVYKRQEGGIFGDDWVLRSAKVTEKSGPSTHAGGKREREPPIKHKGPISILEGEEQRKGGRRAENHIKKRRRGKDS